MNRNQRKERKVMNSVDRLFAIFWICCALTICTIVICFTVFELLVSH